MTTAEIFKFPVAESAGDEIERLRAGMKEWHTDVRGGNTPLDFLKPLDFLVWREVSLAMGIDDLCFVRKAAAALKELTDLRLSDIPF